MKFLIVLKALIALLELIRQFIEGPRKRAAKAEGLPPSAFKKPT
ncbi:damage-inducible type I toxin DinQ [Escherichia coli]